MDARSSLRESINCDMQKKLATIASLRSDIENDFQCSERKKHQEASQLFYYCLMSVYGNLVARESLNRESKESHARKYKSFEEAIVHRIGILWELMENPNNIKRAQNNGDSPAYERKNFLHVPINKLGLDYRALVNEFGGALSQADCLTPELLLQNIQRINLAFIEMSGLFFNQSAHTSFLITRLLSIASAFEFIFHAEYELRSYALKKATVFQKDSMELGFYEKIFTEDESDKFHACFSFQPLYDYLKKMIDTVDERSFDDVFHQFKELCRNYPSIPSEWQPKEKKKKGHYDHKTSPARGDVNAVFLDGSQEVWTPERRMDADSASTPEALAASLGEKLKAKLVALKNGYLGEDGAFSKIPAITQALNDDQPLPLQETDRLYCYAEYLQDSLQDLKIEHALDSLTDTSPKVPAQRPRAHSKNTSGETNGAPPAAAPLQRARSKSKPEQPSYLSPNEAKARHRLGSASGYDRFTETNPAPLVIPSSIVVASPRPSLMPKPATEPYRRQTPQFKPAISMPSVAKYILIGLGIGLLVTALAAAAVALTYFAIHGGAPVLAVAFIAGAKALGGSAIGAWSLVAGILACPPVAGVLGALHRWKRNCESLFSPASSPTIKTRSREGKGSGAHHRIASAPAPVKLRSSQRWKQPAGSVSLVGNASTLYSASPASVVPPAPEEQSLLSLSSR